MRNKGDDGGELAAAAAVQVMPQVKWEGTIGRQGSEAKFHEARQDQGLIDDGLIADFKADSAATSEGSVTAPLITGDAINK